MCLLIAKPEGKSVPESYFRTAFSRNSDGGGFAFAKDGSLHVRKGFFSVDNMIKAYKKLKVDNYPAIIHFRMATHGASREPFNCHPFNVTKNLVFAHNGVLSDKIFQHTKFSDTYMLNERILKPLGDELIESKKVGNWLYEAVKPGKLAFLTNTGRICLVNKDDGHIKDDIWYSNHSYMTYSNGYSKYYYDDDSVDGWLEWIERNRASTPTPPPQNQRSLLSTGYLERKQYVMDHYTHKCYQNRAIKYFIPRDGYYNETFDFCCQNYGCSRPLFSDRAIHTGLCYCCMELEKEDLKERNKKKAESLLLTDGNIIPFNKEEK